MNGSTVRLNGALVARSKNMRGIFDYARKSPINRIDCQRIFFETQDGEAPLYSITFLFDNGAIGECDYADWRVLAHIIKTRRSWDVQHFSGIPEFVAAMRNA